jgi:tetratricopeptide (TPR) repeat protein
MQSAGKFREARRLLLDSEQLEARNPNPDDPDTGVVLLNCGTAYLFQHNYGRAEAFYRRAAAILGRHTQSRAWEVGRIARDLGVICERTRRKKEAVAYYESARKTWEERLAAGPTVPEMYLDLGSLYFSLGQSARALETLETAISQWDLPANPNTPAKVGLLNLYVQVLRRLGRTADARRIQAQTRNAIGSSQASLVRKTVDVRELSSPRPSS